jgi:MoaA/NifB/PqqE/SkfB family radical SAM enzyme
MDPTVRSSYDAARDLTRSRIPAACYAPFVSMYFTTTGHVVACCKSQSRSVGNIAHERLDDIWNGRRLENFRRMVADYALPADCGFCSWQIQGGDYGGVFARIFDAYGVEEAHPRWPKVMEFALSNECNLECVMCTGESSSRIRARRERLPPLPDVYGEQFYADLRKYLPHLAVAKFLGGEPFLIRGNHRIWDMMIEDGLQTPCMITTNGTWLDARVERVLESLPASIFLSIDGATKETVEAIRVGASFELLMEHTRRFIETTRRRGTTFRFIHSMVRRNWSEFPEFLLFAESLGVPTDVCTVVNPPQHSIYTWPPEKLRGIVANYEARDAELSRRLALNLPVWRSTLTSLQKHATEAQTRTALTLSGAEFVEESSGGAEATEVDAPAAGPLVLRRNALPADARNRYLAFDEFAWGVRRVQSLPDSQRLAGAAREAAPRVPPPRGSGRAERVSAAAAPSCTWIERAPRHPLCDVPWIGRPVVLPDGELEYCRFSGVTVGNVNERPLAELWRAPRMQRIRNELTHQRLPDECRSSSCPFLRGDVDSQLRERMEGPRPTAAERVGDALEFELLGPVRIRAGEPLRLSLRFRRPWSHAPVDLFVGVSIPDGSIRFLPELGEVPLPFAVKVEGSAGGRATEVLLAEGEFAASIPPGDYEICAGVFLAGSNPYVNANCLSAARRVVTIAS